MVQSVNRLNPAPSTQNRGPLQVYQILIRFIIILGGDALAKAKEGIKIGKKTEEKRKKTQNFSACIKNSKSNFVVLNSHQGTLTAQRARSSIRHAHSLVLMPQKKIITTKR